MTHYAVQKQTTCMLCIPADSKMLLTACDDMHSHLYDVEHASLVEAFSGERTCHVCLQHASDIPVMYHGT